MLLEFSQQEALSMIQNNDQGATTLPYGGSNGLRGLNQYPGVNASYTGGTTSVSAYGSSGTGSSSGLHDIATYDQLTTNGNAGVNEVTYADIVNFIYALPQEYWTPTAKFVISPLMLAGIRGLTDQQGRPIYVDGLAREDGIVGSLLGFDVVVNKYLDVPFISGSAGTDDLFPMYFGDWDRCHAIVDRLNMVLRRYDQTLPGSITFYGEKRLCTSVVNPFALVRYRSTATATKP
jgi:HK97 family phage major capsid protein